MAEPVSGLPAAFVELALDGVFICRLDSPLDPASPPGDAGARAALAAALAERLRFVRVNAAMCAQYGYPESWFIGRPVRDLMAHDPAVLHAHLARLLEHGRLLDVSGERRADGSTLWVEGYYQLERDADGRLAGCFGIQRDISRRIAAEQALQESEATFRATMDAALVGIFLLQDQKFRYVNPTLCRWFGYAAADLVDVAGPLDLVVPEQHAFLIDQMRRRAAGEPGAPYELTGRRRDGSCFPLLILGAPTTFRGRPASVGTLFDMTAQRVVEEALSESRNRYRALFNGAQDAIVVIDVATGNLMEANVEAELLFRRPREQLAGLPYAQLFPPGARARHADRFRGQVRRGGSLPEEQTIVTADGDEIPVEISSNLIETGEGLRLMQCVFRDLTERHAAEARIRQLAYYDPLTRLPNRSLLQDRVGQALAAAEREGQPVALLFVDLDHFKTINDSLGHFTGDRLLSEVAGRLQACVRRRDTVARLGGDEFVVVLTEAGLEGAAEVARKLIDEVARPYRIDAHDLSVTPSVGISLYPQDGTDFETLLKHADAAMYRAKESGRNGYQFFTREMNVAALERLLLENSLRQALERGEFVLHYQPQVDLSDGRIVGVEALLRWQHPQLGLVPPIRFIPVAETCGLIVPIGAWVLREACRQAAAWQAAGLGPLTVAVNVSSVQFRQGRLADTVRASLAEHGIAPQALELELTEGILMDDAEATVLAVRELSGLGVSLAIDDFGTGYSSLSYLKRFPIDRLKIDRSFVRDVVTDADDWAIARAVISMGRSLRLAVVAEGVESGAQLAMLRGEGCELAQGYHFSPPLLAEACARLLAEQPFLTGDLP